MTRWLAPILVLLLARAPAPCADAPERVVKYADDTLTVRLVNAPVGEVLDEIGRQTGAEIQGHLAEVREVSADFDAEPLPEALHRLLGNQNFALIYGERGLKAVKLLGQARITSSTVPLARPLPGTTIPPQPSAQEPLYSYLDMSVPLPPGSPLTHVLPNPTTIRQLAEVGLRSDDAAVRRDAVRVALRAMDTNPQLKEAVTDALVGTDDVTLSGLLSGTAGAHTEEILALVGEEASGQLRAKARVLLRTMRTGQ
jgi:hypothetical protein